MNFNCLDCFVQFWDFDVHEQSDEEFHFYVSYAHPDYISSNEQQQSYLILKFSKELIFQLQNKRMFSIL